MCVLCVIGEWIVNVVVSCVEVGLLIVNGKFV